MESIVDTKRTKRKRDGEENWVQHKKRKRRASRDDMKQLEGNRKPPTLNRPPQSKTSPIQSKRDKASAAPASDFLDVKTNINQLGNGVETGKKRTRRKGHRTSPAPGEHGPEDETDELLPFKSYEAFPSKPIESEPVQAEPGFKEASKLEHTLSRTGSSHRRAGRRAGKKGSAIHPEELKEGGSGHTKAIDDVGSGGAHPAGRAHSLEKNSLRKADTDMEKLQKKASERVHKQGWDLSEPIGGQFIEADPLFTSDGKYLVFATGAATTVYSTTSSLLTQSLPNGNSGRTVSVCLSHVDPEILYVATDKSRVLRWNFVTGKRLGRWALNEAVQSIQSAQMPDTDVDTLFVAGQSGRDWHITAHRFGSGENPSDTDLATLVELGKPIRSLKVMEGGQLLVATTMEGFLLGSNTSMPKENLKSLAYSWHQILSAEMPSCFDVRVTHTQALNQAKKFSVQPVPKTVDIVIGGVEGCLFVYRDVLNRIHSRLQTPQPREPVRMAPAEMHWHRRAVGAVAWSRDGNYIISGGQETVLVLWQLDTGQKQFLPHLESAVRSVVVSADGAYYAVRLGDNSVMVLSTSELTPTANIVGLQIFGARPINLATSIQATESKRRRLGGDSERTVSCTVNPANPNHLLVAVSAYQNDTTPSATSAAAPYLQIFDINSSRHVTRQALTRVNATNTNLGPEGNRIREPDVKLMDMSADGQWLATIDEWMVPKQDIKDLTINGFQTNKGDRDVQLKFWSWNSNSREWMLNTRIIMPHQQDSSSSCEKILHMVADPFERRFATLGADSVVRVWKLKRKAPTEQVLNGQRKSDTKGATQTKEEHWWTLDYSVALPSASSSHSYEPLAAYRGKLAFSGDGSILLAYQRFEKDGGKERDVLHFIHTSQKVLQQSRTDLCNGKAMHDFGLLDNHLICVDQNAIKVWDITNFQLVSQVGFPPLSSAEESGKNRSSNQQLEVTALTRLAIDPSSKTFAVAVPQQATDARLAKINSPVDHTTQLYVFSLASPTKPLFETKLSHAALALMPACGRTSLEDDAVGLAALHKGYLLLDTSASVRLLRPKINTRRTKEFKQPEAFMQVTSEQVQSVARITEPSVGMDLADGFAEDQMEADDDNQQDGAVSWTSMFSQTEDNRPVVRTQELANVFDYPSHALPPVKDMFRSVVSLFAGKV